MILSRLRVAQTHSRNNDDLVAGVVQPLRETNPRPERLTVRHPETLRFIS